MSVNYWNLFKSLLPEVILVVTALIVLFLDLFRLKALSNEKRFQVGAFIACVGCATAVLWIGFFPTTIHTAMSVWVVDPGALLVKTFLLLLTLFTLILSLQTPFTHYSGEYLVLILLATVGMMFMVSSENLLTIFVALETASLSLYILAGFNKGNRFSAEAALKYFLFGGLSAAVTLYGISLLYGLAGGTDFATLRAQLPNVAGEPLFAAGLAMVTAGLGFKVAAVPFHLWAPDAYEGAPIPSATLIAAGSKVAAFFLLGKLMIQGMVGLEGSAAWQAMQTGWMPALAVLALLSMVLGNLAALVQTSVKRLVAYSAIAHGGYALIGILSGNEQGMEALLYYVILYGFTVVGVFAVIQIVENECGESSMERFAGLSKRSPGVSFCLMIFVLSLAGIPPLAGFFGKFYLFAAALNSDSGQLGVFWLVLVALLMSAVSLYYYLQLLKQVYINEPPRDCPPMPVPVSSMFIVITLATIVVVLGCLPDLLLGMIQAAMEPVALQ